MISTSSCFHYCFCFFIDALFHIAEKGCKWDSLPKNRDELVEKAPLAADRAYESDRTRRGIVQNPGMTRIASPKANRKSPRDFDKGICRLLNEVERLFGRPERRRRICKRCDKLDATFPTFFNFAPIFDML